MKKSFGFGVGIACVLLVSACGGGGGGGGGSSSGSDSGGTTTGGGTSGPATYEKLSSKAATTSKLGGVALRNDGSGFVQVTGNLTHNTGALNIKAGSLALNDPNGPDSSGAFQDKDGSEQLTYFTDTGRNYDYVTPFYLTEDPNSLFAQTAVGYVGVVTEDQDVPNSGTATYVGIADGSYLETSNGVLRSASTLNGGRSKVKAYFDSGTVNVTMNDFDTRDLYTQQSVTVPFDTIKATGMKISGNGFSGGQVKIISDGSQVNVTGSNSTSQVSGKFYGYDQSISGPDEVAGAASLIGDSGNVSVLFDGD